jgi:cobalt/nickel transport system ATP-binding protein
MSEPALELSGVRFAYPDGRLALDGVDLAVQQGERVAVLGPNGAGKTTLVLHSNGVLRPHEGEVRVGGTLVDDASLREVRTQVGLVFQDPDDQLFLPTVRRDVAFGPHNQGLRGTDLDATVDAALDRFGLLDLAERPPHHLSVGEKRRATLAGVFAMDPSVLVLDEPTANLDPWARQELGRLLADLEVTQVVVTHDLLFALEHCARSVILDAGRVVADGPTTQLLGDVHLLAAHRLVLPAGAAPGSATAGGTLPRKLGG